ncbi:hypothetical protein BDW02DRAFT_564252 [Decorospora gaudefroyi]|uniref:Uncharacterized protein n=1 Tax=Decorospora gaudefroyi TaxID=184978 RepID=A0A6A5KW71_9PLEO|nr:hypothetical protein BDW02DRAFT_564252 [Decorospora gaudefroyi]
MYLQSWSDRYCDSFTILWTWDKDCNPILLVIHRVPSREKMNSPVLLQTVPQVPKRRHIYLPT